MTRRTPGPPMFEVIEALGLLQSEAERAPYGDVGTLYVPSRPSPSLHGLLSGGHMPPPLSPEDFERACAEVRTIARFHGEDDDPSVTAVLEEAKRARASEGRARKLLRQILEGGLPIIAIEAYLAEP